MFGGLFSFPWFRTRQAVRVMQFQARLLKDLGAPSTDAARWRDRIKKALIEASGVIKAHFLYAFLLGEDDKRTIELFWLKPPSPDAVKSVEALLKRKIAEDSEFGDIRDFGIVHSTALPEAPTAEVRSENIELLSRTFYLNTPSESGFVGIGLQADGTRGSSELIAIDAVLTVFVNVISSLKALCSYTRNVERFATRDPLTALYNRVSFLDLLEYETNRSMRQKYRFSLLLIDLDDFKAVNDSYGHETGDAFLKDFASLLKNAVRSGDIAARYAGDQFAAVLPICDEGQARAVIGRILDALRTMPRPLPNGGSFTVTASIGLAVFPDHAKDANDLFELADDMLAQAKTLGKDRFCLPSELDDVHAHKSMGTQNIMILEALSQHRFIPHFQPIMNLKDLRIEAYEVLTRINAGDRIIPACEFIEAAEGMGAIGKIDYQLLDLALAKARECNYTGKLFINLSPKAFVMRDFMPTIRQLLRDHGMSPSLMVFEITERDTVKDLKGVEFGITELRQEGFRFAIDDFGAGYSSFRYLRSFTVDYLKLDGEFIRHMKSAGGVEKNIVTSIASLASDLGIKTIAEFVESKDILTEVESAGVTHAQGYYIQRPSPDLF
jgi:diguanylate cyclase (GGDEF)-like protein